MTPTDRQPPVARRRPTQPRSDDEVAEAIVRFVKALGGRCATGDPDGAKLLQLVDEAVEAAWLTAVEGWREAGFSDAYIGRELQITRQAVQKRWPR